MFSTRILVFVNKSEYFDTRAVLLDKQRGGDFIHRIS